MVKKIVSSLGWVNFKKTVENYSWSDFKSDFLAGSLVGVVAFPSVMAFAMLAGINPIYGLHSLIVAAIVGTFFGVSSFMVMGPTNIIALLLANAVGTLTLGSLSVFETIILLTLMTGIIQVILSFVNFSRIAGYISRPVIVGLVTGVAFAIVGSQLPKILGLEIGNGQNIFINLYRTIVNLNNINLLTTFIGGITILIVLVSKKFFPKAPGYLLAVIFSIVTVYLFDLGSQVEIVGSLRNSLPTFSLPSVDFKVAIQLFSYAFAAAMLGFIDVVTITEFNRKGALDKEGINKDYLSLGIVNVTCSLFGGFVGGGSFSRSFINYKAGAKTRFSQLIVGLFVLLFLVFFSPIISLLPKVALTAILILVAFEMVSLEKIKKILQTTKFDAMIFFATFGAILVIPRLDYAVYFGVLLSLFLVIHRSNKVKNSYLKIEENKIVQEELANLKDKNKIVIDLSGALHFNTVFNLERKLEEAFKKEKTFILRMRNVEEVDITTISELEKFIEMVREEKGDVYFTGLSSELKEKFKEYGLLEKLGKENYFSKEEEVFSSTKKAVKKESKK